MMIYFNYPYDLRVLCAPWRWAKHTGLTLTLELVVPIVEEAGIRSLDHPVHSKSDCKVSPGLRFVWACRHSWSTISLGSQWLLASSRSCLPVSPRQDGPKARTAVHGGHVSASCDAESDKTTASHYNFQHCQQTVTVTFWAEPSSDHIVPKAAMYGISKLG
jgi:hypothetical protein